MFFHSSLSEPCRNRAHIFPTQSPSAGHLGYRKGCTLFCSKAGWTGHLARGARGRSEVEGRGRGLVPPPAPDAIFSVAPSPDSKLRKEPPRGAGPPPPPLSSHHLWVPGGAPVPAAAGGTICAAQVCPAPCPTWGLRTLGRLWPPRARRAAARGLPSVCSGPRGRAAGGAGRGRGPRPRRAPFKRCQGLIDEKWPRAGANLSREVAGRRAGARDGEAA